MKAKLIALLFLVGSVAFAAPRVVVGVGVGPAYGYSLRRLLFRMSRPRPFIGAPAPITALAGLDHATMVRAFTDADITAGAFTAVIGGANYTGRRPSKASCSNARMPSRVMGRGL